VSPQPPPPPSSSSSSSSLSLAASPSSFSSSSSSSPLSLSSPSPPSCVRYATLRWGDSTETQAVLEGVRGVVGDAGGRVVLFCVDVIYHRPACVRTNASRLLRLVVIRELLLLLLLRCSLISYCCRRGDVGCRRIAVAVVCNEGGGGDVVRARARRLRAARHRCSGTRIVTADRAQSGTRCCFRLCWHWPAARPARLA
jgi:hypothetical protein